MTAGLHLVTDRDRRGAQVHASDLCEGLREVGATADLVALAPGTHGDLLEIDALGAGRRSRTTFAGLRRRAQDYDVVVAHGSATLLACAVGLAGTGIPFVYRQISDPLFWASTPWRRLRVAAMIRRAARVVALSDGVGDTFAGHYRLDRGRVVTIPNAVPGRHWAPASRDERPERRAELGLPEDGVAIVHVGALVPEKGVPSVVRLASVIEGVYVVIVGDGPDRDELEALATRTAPARVIFTGSLDEPRRAFAATDVLVLASRGGDSMPAVLIEAGLCGLPAVSTPVGAIPDVVEDGVTGRIVPIGDEEGLVGAVRALVDDRTRREAMGAAARARCLERFTIEAVAPRWQRLLDEVAAAG